MKAVILVVSMLVLSGCSVLEGLVYKMDIPQGNYLEQRDVDKLRIGMSKEQVKFVLGAPVADNPFQSDKWHYIYHLQPGNGDLKRSEVIIEFEDDRLARLEGDFEKSEDFNTPLDQ